jgi:hypothetical protein
VHRVPDNEVPSSIVTPQELNKVHWLRHSLSCNASIQALQPIVIRLLAAREQAPTALCGQLQLYIARTRQQQILTWRAIPIVPFFCQVTKAELSPGSGTRTELVQRGTPFVTLGAFAGSPPLNAKIAAWAVLAIMGPEGRTRPLKPTRRKQLGRSYGASCSLPQSARHCHCSLQQQRNPQWRRHLRHDHV